MEIAKSNIVRSDAGRDKGKLFYVLDTQGEYLLLAGGKSRKVESPKRKKRRQKRQIPEQHAGPELKEIQQNSRCSECPDAVFK